MEDKHVRNLLPEYIDGVLEKSRQKAVALHLDSCSDCRREWDQLRTLLKAFDEEEKEVPGERLRSNFYALLEREMASSKKVIPLRIQSTPIRATALLKVAAGVALLIGAFFLGKYEQQQRTGTTIRALVAQSNDMRQTAMLSLLGNRSASKRIQGVNYIEEFSDPDKTIMEALIRRMILDDNTNVRLAAVDALQQFKTSPGVTASYIKALETEKEPAVQLALIRILVSLREKKAVPPMQKLLENTDTENFIKEQIKSLLPTLV